MKEIMNNMKRITILIIALMLINPAFAASGVGIKYAFEHADAIQNDITCIEYGVYNPFDEDITATILAEGDFAEYQFRPKEIDLPANTGSADSKDIDLCFKIPKIIDNCYDGHDGAGYRYGCSDPIMDEHCRNTCRLYKAKKSQSTMSSGDMEIALINFIKDNVSPCNIGHLYGQNFPIYPGEVVILQAPPASMKTMLLQNWMVDLKKTTYFMEMEMSPRQIWSRFVMMEMGWTEEELIEHYNKGRNGIDERFKWLTVDYASCYPYELEKRIIMQANKPEIVVVDHMGLFKSKYEDNNRKVEEASQALMELAVKHNIIVFAVSEISKQAFNEGMNMASAKGSFRIAYNANKLLSVKPLKNQAGLIEMLHITSTKNREKEQLNVQLKVNNVRITKYE